MEVLQTGSRNAKLLPRFAFWSALILVLPRFRRVLFLRCSHVWVEVFFIGPLGNNTTFNALPFRDVLADRGARNPELFGNLPLRAAIHQHLMTNDMYLVPP